jgi:hypothetical protein
MRGNASPGGWAVVDDAIQAEAGAAFSFLADLIATLCDDHPLADAMAAAHASARFIARFFAAGGLPTDPAVAAGRRGSGDD